MILITTDSDLRKYIPNAFTTIPEETSLFHKMTPWLAISEQWLIDCICGPTLAEIASLEDNNIVKMLASQIVVSDAMRSAIPSLDLVLTPNGFGIVSNNNVAPASKDRVERLIQSLISTRDNCIEQLLTHLRQFSTWKSSTQCQWFSATLFPNIDVVTLCGITVDRWEKYRELRSKIKDIEDYFAEDYFSHEFMNVLRGEVIADTKNSNRAWVISRIRPHIISLLSGKPIIQRKMMDIVNFIRHNPNEFPEWHSSDTAKLFSPPTFVNKKESGGYFF